MTRQPCAHRPHQRLTTDILILCVSFVALILFSNAAKADEWTTGEKVAEGGYLALHAIDWVQSRYIADNPRQYHENSPLLGDHPPMWRVDAYFIGTTVAQIAIANILPSDWRDLWIGAGVVVAFTATAHNASLGVGYRW